MKLSLSIKISLLAFCLFGVVSFSSANFADPATTCSSITIYTESECLALLNIYNTLGGDNWTNKTNRGTNDGDWYGVTTSNADGLRTIDLSGNNLSGNLTPYFVSGFEFLELLNLSNNNIKGIEDGAFLGAGDWFSWLYLSNNQISDLKDGTFQGLTNTTMSEISLDHNQLTEIKKSDFNGLSLSLGSLNLGYNKITNIESDIFADFPYMSYIYLNNNLLTYLDSSIFTNLDYLITVELFGNCLDTSIRFNYYCPNIVRGRESSQKICLQVKYTPSTTTTGVVVGDIIFTGGSLTGRNILNANPISHTWTQDGLFTYDLSAIANSDLLMYTTIVGDVTWIEQIAQQAAQQLASSGSNQESVQTPVTETSSPVLGTRSAIGGGLQDTQVASSQSASSNTTLQELSNDKMQIIISADLPKEIKTSYLRAYSNGITSIDSILDANVEGTLIREHMAKMITNYAVNILKKTINTGIHCSFTDMADQSPEMQNYAKLSCELGLMGLNSDGSAASTFNPNGTVSRAEFGTVLSRLLYGDVNNTNDSSTWYEAHLNALKNNGIIKNADPELKELRGYVMLMLMRASE